MLRRKKDLINLKLIMKLKKKMTEPSIIDYYNDFPNVITVIEKMNEEYEKLRIENEKLKKENGQSR